MFPVIIPLDIRLPVVCNQAAETLPVAVTLKAEMFPVVMPFDKRLPVSCNWAIDKLSVPTRLAIDMDPNSATFARMECVVIVVACMLSVLTPNEVSDATNGMPNSKIGAVGVPRLMTVAGDPAGSVIVFPTRSVEPMTVVAPGKDHMTS